MTSPTYERLEDVVLKVRLLPESKKLDIQREVSRQMIISKRDYDEVVNNPVIPALDRQRIQCSYEEAQAGLINMDLPSLARGYETFANMMCFYGRTMPNIYALLGEKPLVESVPARSA